MIFHGREMFLSNLDEFDDDLTYLTSRRHWNDGTGLYTCGPSPIAHARLCKVTNDVYLDNVVGLDVSKVVVGGNWIV